MIHIKEKQAAQLEFKIDDYINSDEPQSWKVDFNLEEAKNKLKRLNYEISELKKLIKSFIDKN